jgi:DNA-binding MarR family transcriptional regulator
MSIEKDLDRTIHQPIRLKIVSILYQKKKVRFTELSDRIDTSEGNLGTHLRTLEERGYIHVEKKFEDRKPVTTYELSRQGERKFKEYIAKLEDMIQSLE